MQEIHLLRERQEWNDLAAVKNNAVFIVDSDLFTCPSTRLVEGIELLAALFHPPFFDLPVHLNGKVKPLHEKIFHDGKA